MPPLRGCEEGIRKIGASSHEPGARAARLGHAAAARLGETGSSSPWLKTGGSRSRATPYRLAASEGGKGPTTNLSLTSQVGWLLVASRTAAACRSLAAPAPGSWSDDTPHSPLPAAQRRHVVAWRRQPQVHGAMPLLIPPSQPRSGGMPPLRGWGKRGPHRRGSRPWALAPGPSPAASRPCSFARSEPA